MPIYEFVCRECEGEFELFIRSVAESELCPSCGSVNLQKKFSVFGVKSAAKVVSSGGGGCSGCSGRSCAGCNH